MRKPDLADFFSINGKRVEVEWFNAPSEEYLPDVSWQQVYVIGNLNGKIPVVLYDFNRPNLPGGKTEPGEAIADTLRRELAEEINCHVLSWHPIGYQKLTEPDSPSPVYQLRVYAELEKVGDFIADPGGGVIGYELINFKELNEIIQYGKVGERIMNLVSDKF